MRINTNSFWLWPTYRGIWQQLLWTLTCPLWAQDARVAIITRWLLGVTMATPCKQQVLLISCDCQDPLFAYTRDQSKAASAANNSRLASNIGRSNPTSTGYGRRFALAASFQLTWKRKRVRRLWRALKARRQKTRRSCGDIAWNLSEI